MLQADVCLMKWSPFQHRIHAAKNTTHLSALEWNAVLIFNVNFESIWEEANVLLLPCVKEGSAKSQQLALHQTIWRSTSVPLWINPPLEKQFSRPARNVLVVQWLLLRRRHHRRWRRSRQRWWCWRRGRNNRSGLAFWLGCKSVGQLV